MSVCRHNWEGSVTPQPPCPGNSNTNRL